MSFYHLRLKSAVCASAHPSRSSQGSHPSYILSLPPSFLTPSHISSCSNFPHPPPTHMYKKLSSHVLSFTSSFSLFFPTSQPNFWKTHMLFLVLSHFLLNLLNSFYSPYFINMVAPHVKCLLFAKSSGHLRFIFWFLGKPHTPGLSATSSPLLDSDEIPFLCYAVNTNPLGSLLSPLFLLYIH